MMNFFENINTQETEFDLGGGDLQPIPKDTRVLASAEEVKNDEYNGSRYINIKWRILQPAEYANRVLFQKIKVYDANPDTATKHKKMLAAIATNAGGRLFTAMQQANEIEPSDNSLLTICNSPMVLLLDVWELDDKSKSGNWVKSVSPRKGSAPAPAPTPAPAAIDSFEDDIPF